MTCTIQQCTVFKRLFKKPLLLKDRLFTYRKGIYLECINAKKESVITEASPLFGWSQESYEEVLNQLNKWQKIPQISWATLDTYPCFSSVAFAIESALLHFSSSLCSYQYPHTNLALDAKGVSSNGKSYKIKAFGKSFEQLLTQMRYIQEKNPLSTLRIDANQCWSLEEALRFASIAKPMHIEYIEEPVKRFKDLYTFSKKTGLPIAVDEMLYTHTLEELLEIPTLRACIIKPTLFGGVRKCKKFIEHLPSSVHVVFSSSFETEVGLCHIARLHHLFKEKCSFLGLDTLKYFETL